MYVYVRPSELCPALCVAHAGERMHSLFRSTQMSERPSTSNGPNLSAAHNDNRSVATGTFLGNGGAGALKTLSSDGKSQESGGIILDIYPP